MNCLLCSVSISVGGWLTFFMKGEDRTLCRECEQKFEKLEGELCTCCGRPLQKLAATHQDGGMCIDCIRWEEGPMRGVLLQNRSLYLYNDWGKDVLARYKFRGDAVLATIFFREMRRMRKHFPKVCRVIAVPLSAERQYERGFNQAELLAACLQRECSHFVTRVHSEKQSKKTRAERLMAQSPFLFSSTTQFTGEHILLVDDVYTTGTTLRQIGKLFHERGAAAVHALTIFRG